MTPARRRAAVGPPISLELEVPLHDVDLLQVVWHGHYAKYLEMGSTALLRSRQLDVSDCMELGYRLLVVDWRCRYVFPLRYRDRFRVEAWFTDVENRLAIGYELTNLTHQRRCARANTTLVSTDPNGNLFYETPDALLGRIRGAVAAG
jgi:acyl-CoA thioester hydrolase